MGGRDDSLPPFRGIMVETKKTKEEKLLTKILKELKEIHKIADNIFQGKKSY